MTKKCRDLAKGLHGLISFPEITIVSNSYYLKVVSRCSMKSLCTSYNCVDCRANECSQGSNSDV